MRLPVRRLALVAAAALAAALAGPPAGALASSGQAPVSQRAVTVLSRNLYLGADLTRVLTAANPVVGMAQVAAVVEASQPATRMAEVAAEVVAAKPDLVALQEVADWRIRGLNPLTGQPLVPPADYDFLALLQQALRAQGSPYHVVVAQENFDSATQLPPAVQLLATFADRDVILARDGLPVSQLQVLGTAAGHYAAQLSIPVASLGVTLDFDRGWESALVRTRGKVWRVVNTHPEAYSPADLGLPGGDVNGAQATELVGVLAGSTGPTVVLGDLNSAKGDTSRAGYAVLAAAGFTDTWLALGLPDGAATCCRDEALTGGALTERIDHVLARGLVTPTSATHIGVGQESTTPPLWPSDHAGVVTSLTVGKQEAR